MTENPLTWDDLTDSQKAAYRRYAVAQGANLAGTLPAPPIPSAAVLAQYEQETDDTFAMLSPFTAPHISLFNQLQAEVKALRAEVNQLKYGEVVARQQFALIEALFVRIEALVQKTTDD